MAVWRVVKYAKIMANGIYINKGMNKPKIVWQMIYTELGITKTKT